MSRRGPGSRALHRYACLTAGATFLLLVAGAAVTSTGSGLAVPDWPLSYGRLLPRMVGGVFFEHSHRLIAGVVSLLILGLCVWVRLAEPRAWVRRLAYAALGLVLVQALLGGLTVLLLLPPAVSVAHAATAMLLFGLTVVLAGVTAQSWRDTPEGSAPGMARLMPWAALAAGLVYAQILVGAVMRHLGAGLACPDFPLCQGRLVPSLGSAYVAVHYFHRVGGVLVVLSVALLGILAARQASVDARARVLSFLAAGLVLAQFALGALSVTTRLAPQVTVAHHAGGALLFALTLWLAVWTRRVSGREPAAQPALSARLAGEAAR